MKKLFLLVCLVLFSVFPSFATFSIVAIDPDTGRPSYDPARTPTTGQITDFCPSLWGGKD